MTPVAFALFIIALVWPLQRRLKAVLPQVIAVLVTASVALLAIGAGGWLVIWGFGGITHWVIANAARLQGLYMHAADLLEQRGLYAAELFAEQVNVLWLVQVLRAIGGSLQGVFSFCIVTFVFVILGLLEVEPLGRRLRRIGSEGAIDTVAEIAARLQTYMLVRFGMSVLTGLSLLGLHGCRRARAAPRMGGDRFRPELHSLYRLFHCHLAAHPVRGCPVRVAIRRARRVHRPQSSSVRHWQLHRTTCRGECGFGLPLHGAVCGILLGHAVGHRRRIYRCADPDRACDRLRQVPFGSPDRSPALSRRNEREDEETYVTPTERPGNSPQDRLSGLEISQNCKARGCGRRGA